ncbi:aspartate aminotransferase family protein [Amycolatopsis sp. NPDC058986]|uniref:aminotransferase family protein n=1 Tax=unclassified Amycolatopsis TaxID=2618356 RepID=UPI00366FCA30
MHRPTISHADGVYLYDQNSKEYLDGSSGVLNTNLGHRNPDIIARIIDQLDRVCFVHRSQFISGALDQLTQTLVSIAPVGLDHIEYSNSGSEANECALRVTLAYHHRNGEHRRRHVLTEKPSYHGMTAGALSLSGHPQRRTAAFAPLLDNHVATPRVTPRAGQLRAGLGEWIRAIRARGPQNIAAVLIEPLGGASSGAAPMSLETVRGLRSLADEHGFLLIADEVMSGLGRTGSWWAIDTAGVTPDLLTTSKGLTGGYTSLAATLINRTVAQAFEGDIGSVIHGHTMSGNPLAAATSLAVLDYTIAHDLPRRAGELGVRLRAQLDVLRTRHPCITDVRGRGLMLGLGLTYAPHRPSTSARQLTIAARNAGLILCPAGINTTTESVLIAPPLTSTEDDIDELTRRLDAALTAC